MYPVEYFPVSDKIKVIKSIYEKEPLEEVFLLPQKKMFYPY